MHDNVFECDFAAVFANIPAPSSPVRLHVAKLSAARARVVLAKFKAGEPLHASISNTWPANAGYLAAMVDDLAGIIEGLTA